MAGACLELLGFQASVIRFAHPYWRYSAVFRSHIGHLVGRCLAWQVLQERSVAE